MNKEIAFEIDRNIHENVHSCVFYSDGTYTMTVEHRPFEHREVDGLWIMWYGKYRGYEIFLSTKEGIERFCLVYERVFKKYMESYMFETIILDRK